MDSVLVIITTISLVLAVAMGIIVLRVLRDESQRAAARVALLTTAARDDDPLLLHEPDESVRPVAPDPLGTAAGTLFSHPGNDPPWLRRLGAAAILAGVVAAAGYAGMKNAGPTAPRAGLQALPLELLALRHAPQPDALIVSGTVRNPRGGATVSDVIVTAALFSADGSLLASARAPLDFPTLAPGDESPFVITIPVNGTVARYRVGFRSPDGSVMAHVDRRTNLVSAQTAGVGGSTP